MKKKLLVLVVIIAVAAVGVYFYTYKGHRDITTEKASFSLSVKDLQQEFLQNDSLANSKYLDNTIEIYGKISSLDSASNGIVLDEKLFATFKDSTSRNLTQGATLKIKGRFIGYDDLLEEFKMDQVSIVE